MFDATGLFSDSRLFVVGNINRDIRCAPIPRGDYLFEDGETPADFVRETAGGGAANSALAAAALGMHVAFAGKIGHDSLGERLERLLADHGIRSFLRKDAGVATGTSINLAFSTGHRHFVSCLENNRSLAFDDLDLSELGSYRHLVRGDIWFSEPMLFGGNERLFRAAKDAGLAVSIDLNWDPAWAGGDEQRIRARKAAARAALPYVDLAHGNVRELNRFADSDDLRETLTRLTGWGVGAVVVHLGAEGAGCFRGGEWITAPAQPARRQVNATGTGDVLSVCLIGLHHRDDLAVAERLRIGNRIVSEFIEGERRLMPELT